MRQAVLMVLAAALAVCAGCGGGSKTSSTAPSSIVISTATVSLNQGQVFGLTATVLDANGSPATNPKAIVWSTSNANIATVTSDSGGVCAGVWDSNHIVCAPGQVGTATITATSDNLTATSTIYVHQKVDRVLIPTPTGACKSVGQTLQLSAQALSNGTDITSTVGPFNWTVGTPAVASIDANGLLTATAPGQSPIVATVSNVTSVPVTYTTCAVKSIHVHVSGASDTSFTLAGTSATQTLAADVVDTAGNTINPTLTWVSNAPGTISVSQPTGTTASTTQTATAATPGTASVIAECAINCNYNLAPVYSDVVVGTVGGNNASIVYVTGTGTTSLIPIDTGTNAPGTAVTLPAQPNSLVFSPLGNLAYLGSSTGLITLNTATNAVSQNTAFPGKVLAVSADGNRAIVADASLVYGVFIGASSTSATTDTLGITGATAAAFLPDNTRAYIVAGTNAYIYTPSGPTAILPLSGSATDVAISPSAAFAYIANGVTNAISARATCDASVAGTFATPGPSAKLAVTPDAAKVLAVDAPNLDVFTRSSLAQMGCPPALTGTVSSVDLGQGAFTPTRLVLTSNGAKAYIVSDLAKVIAYDVATATPSAINLANGAQGLSASATLDGTKLYVGGSDNNVHRIDTAAGTDAQQISVSFTPNLVAVKPK